AVGNILFEAVPREASAGSGLGGDHRSNGLLFEPTKQATQLGTNNRLVRQSGEQNLDRVQDQTLGADGSNPILDPHEQPGKVVFSRLLEFRSEEHTSELQSPCNLV